MTGKELHDNLTFLSALRMLGSLVEQGLLSEKEAEQTRGALNRRLRPTVLLA